MFKFCGYPRLLNMVNEAFQWAAGLPVQSASENMCNMPTVCEGYRIFFFTFAQSALPCMHHQLTCKVTQVTSQSKVLIEVAGRPQGLPCWAPGLPGPLLGAHLAPYPGGPTHIWHR